MHNCMGSVKQYKRVLWLHEQQIKFKKKEIDYNLTNNTTAAITKTLNFYKNIKNKYFIRLHNWLFYNWFWLFCISLCCFLKESCDISQHLEQRRLWHYNFPCLPLAESFLTVVYVYRLPRSIRSTNGLSSGFKQIFKHNFKCRFSPIKSIIV